MATAQRRRRPEVNVGVCERNEHPNEWEWDTPLTPSRPLAQAVVQRLRLFGVGAGAPFPMPSPSSPPPPSQGGRRRGRPSYEHEALYRAHPRGHDPEAPYVVGERPGVCAAGVPWYPCGGETSSSTPGTSAPSFLQTVQRYGWRGSLALREYQGGRLASVSARPPLLTLRRTTPAFLHEGVGTTDADADPWTPLLLPQPPTTHWPSNSEYVEGFKAKCKSTSHVYNKETTVNDDAQPVPDVRLTRIRQREMEEQRLLQEGMAAERAHHRRAAAAAAGATRRKSPPPSSPPQSPRWQALAPLHALLVHFQPARHLRSAELETLAACLQRHCVDADRGVMSRESFNEVLSKRFGGRLLHEHSIKLEVLFSLFRRPPQPHVCFVDVVALLLVLDVDELALPWHAATAATPGTALASAQRTLVRLFRLYQRYRRDCNVTDNVAALLATCVQNDHDAAQMDAMVRRHLLPACYRLAAVKTLGDSRPLPARPTAPRTSPRGSQAVVYTICDGVLQEPDFEQALRDSPSVVRLFQEQMVRAQALAAVGRTTCRRTVPPRQEEDDDEDDDKEGVGNGGGRREIPTRPGSSTLGNLFPRRPKRTEDM